MYCGNLLSCSLVLNHYPFLHNCVTLLTCLMWSVIIGNRKKLMVASRDYSTFFMVVNKGIIHRHRNVLASVRGKL